MDVGINIKEFPPNKLKLWDEAVLNQSEYTAYLVNKRKVSFSFLARFLDDYLIKYHDKILKEKYPDKFENINYYSELKSLVKRLRERKEKDKLMLKVYVIIGLLLLLIALIFLLYNVS